MYYFIEAMTEDDIPRVQVIERQSFTTPWSANTYRREIRSLQNCRYVIARASATPPAQRPRTQTPVAPRPFGVLSQLVSIFLPEPPAPTPNSLPPDPTPIVGYGGVWLTVDDAHITTIAVDPLYRGQGIGELLLNALIDHAYDLGAHQITLEVRISNTSAQRLYLKYGFQPGGTRPRYYTDNSEDALIMWTEGINTAEFKARLAELRRQLVVRLQRQAGN